MPIVEYRGKQVTFPDDITESEINEAMGSIADQIDTDLLAETTKPKGAERTVGGTIKDLGVAAVKSAISLPETVVGLVDIANRSTPQSIVKKLITGKEQPSLGKVLEDSGVRFSDAKNILNEFKSDAQKEADANVENAEGVIDTTVAAVKNPSVIVNAGVESIAPMLGGGLIGRGLLSAAPKLAGAIGEGAVSAGAQAESIRQQSANGELTNKQAAIAAATGVGTSIFGAFGANLAKKFGVGDIDTIIAGGVTNKSSKSFPIKLIEGGIAEGVFEELPQSVQEQMLSNWALDKPITEGVDKAAVMGTLTGGMFGAGAQFIPGKSNIVDEVNNQQQKADAALENITNPDITVDDAIELAKVAIETPMVSDVISTDNSLLSEINQATEAIPATDILGDDNVSENDAITELATDTSGLIDNQPAGSAGDSVLQPVDSTNGRVDSDAATLAQSSGFSDAVREGDTGNPTLSIEKVNVDEAGTPFVEEVSVIGDTIDAEWTAFNPETGTLGIPRSEMPQIKAEVRGPMVNFLNARGIQQSQETIPASTLKPTQQEFSAAKVQKAIDFEGGNRSILVSADNHILDGHHQWLAKLNAGEDIDVIRFDAPIAELIETVKEFPSATVADGASEPVKVTQDIPKVTLPAKSKLQPTSNPLFEKNRAAIESLAPRMNWATIGNKRIDDAQGNQIGRTKFEPIDDAMEQIRKQGTLSYNGMREAVGKALEGKPLSKAEQRTIDLIADYAENNDVSISQPITDEQVAKLQAVRDAETEGSFDELVYGLDSTTAKIAVTELSDDALDSGIGNVVSTEEFEAWLNAEGTNNEQKTGNERVETQAGRDDTRGAQSETSKNPQGNSAERDQQQSAPVQAQENNQVRPVVEAITKRRAAAAQIGKEKPFDTYLALAKKLMKGEVVKPTNFKLAAAAFKADAKLAEAFNQLQAIAQAPAKEARADKTNTIDAYKQRIAAAKTVDALQTIAGDIQRDSALSDTQAATLDDAVFDAQDALEVNESPTNKVDDNTRKAEKAAIDAANKEAEYQSKFDVEEELKSIANTGNGADIAELANNPEYWDEENEELTDKGNAEYDRRNLAIAKERAGIGGFESLGELDNANQTVQAEAFNAYAESLGLYTQKSYSTGGSRYVEVSVGENTYKVRFADHFNTVRDSTMQPDFNVAEGRNDFAEAIDWLNRKVRSVALASSSVVKTVTSNNEIQERQNKSAELVQQSASGNETNIQNNKSKVNNDLLVDNTAAKQAKDEVTRAKEALDTAGVTGTEKLNTIAQVRDGKITADEVVEAHGVEPKKSNDDEVLFSRSAKPTFYSSLNRAIEDIKTNKADTTTWKGMIRNLAQKGVKPDEIKWTGVNEWLDLQTGSVTKEQVLDYLGANGVQVEDVMLGGRDTDMLEINGMLDEAEISYDFDAETGTYQFYDGDYDLDLGDLPTPIKNKINQFYKKGEIDGVKYSQYTVAGGENYKELLLTLPVKEIERPKMSAMQLDRGAYQVTFSDTDRFVGNEVIADGYQDAVNLAWNRYQRENPEKFGNYRSSHFEQKNILAHVRFDERTDADGNKVLFINEIQSDYGQDYKKSKAAINKAVDDDFDGIVKRMKLLGVLEVNCD